MAAKKRARTDAEAARELARNPGIGAAKARELVARGVKTRRGQRAAAAELPPEARARLRYPVRRSIPRREAERVAAEICRRLVFSPAGTPPGPGGGEKYPVRVVGSLRRGAPASKDLDLLVVVPDRTDPRGLLAGGRLAGAGTARFVATYSSGPRRRSVIVSRGRGKTRRYYAVDLFLAARSELPYALLAHSGPQEYVVRLRALAKRRGWLLNQYGLYEARGQKKTPVDGSRRAKTEREVLSLLGATYRSPARREEGARARSKKRAPNRRPGRSPAAPRTWTSAKPSSRSWRSASS